MFPKVLARLRRKEEVGQEGTYEREVKPGRDGGRMEEKGSERL